jgi:hypothetical protein
VVNPVSFEWNDSQWQGVGIEGQVLYEMHIGTFTREGSWKAAQRELMELADCGISVLEVMPVADFPGRFGWGYDGVGLFAPVRLYGEPDDFRRFVDGAHSAGLGVILDVVYNHFGGQDCLGQFSPDYSPAGTRTTGQAIIPMANAGQCAVFPHKRSILDRNSTSTDFVWTPRSRSSTRRLAISWRRSANACGKRRAGERRSLLRRMDADTKLVSSLDSGGFGLDALLTTTSITAAWSR